MPLRLIPNAGAVAAGASSMWALYGVFFIDAGIKIMELFILHSREWTWKDFVVPILSIVAMTCRLIYQEKLSTATEKKLAEEQIARKKFEDVAQSDIAPINAEDAKYIKEDAAKAVDTILKE